MVCLSLKFRTTFLSDFLEYPHKVTDFPFSPDTDIQCLLFSQYAFIDTNELLSKTLFPSHKIIISDG